MVVQNREKRIAGILSIGRSKQRAGFKAAVPEIKCKADYK